jgi:hypothetical protein
MALVKLIQGKQINVNLTGSFTGSFTGSLFGTSSFAISSSRATTSSFAVSASWAPMRPGGSNTQIQYNSNGTLAGDSMFTFNDQSESLQQGFNVTASGFYSHAQGSNTQAIGNTSHAEGQGTAAIGAGSHAEGSGTISSGSYSHAEGRSTVALGDYQHVEGQFNVLSSAQSAFIIGNGTSNASRSNLVFASGSQFQISGSLVITGSLQGLGTVTFPNINNAGYTDVLYRNPLTGEVTYATMPPPTSANVDEINIGTSGNVFVRPEELEQSKHSTINIYNNLNFI